MKRQAFNTLIEWKNKPERKPLILEGARQVGKTWLLKEFGKKQYANTAYINFDSNKNMLALFEQDMDINRILIGLELEADTKITPHDTLIIFDEIQENPNALNSLKYFYENAPEYHIAAAGSLLGVALTHQGKSFPVGKVDFMSLYPMSFYEFLDAVGEERLASLLTSDDLKLTSVFKNKYIDWLKRYLYIGGMPEVVKSFAAHKDFNQVREIQNALLKSYENDFVKHIDKAEISKISMIWKSISVQLAKENKKFVYKDIKAGARSKDFENALLWLVKAGLVYQVNKISKPDLPLYGYEERSAFKLYMLDTGLFCAMSLLEPKTLLEECKIFTEFKGSLTEQYVLQELKTLPIMPITYWAGRNSKVGFVIQKGNNVIPIEVKAGTNLKAKSLKVYQEKYAPSYSIRTSLADFKKTDDLYDIPLYAIASLNGLVD